MTVLTGHARVAGIIGWPVSHSRSPRLHGYWLDKHGIDGAYIPLPIPPENFRDTVRGLLHAGFAGANVTIPHKLAAFEVCDTVDEMRFRAAPVRLTHSLSEMAGSLARIPTVGVSSPISARMASTPGSGPALFGRRRRSPSDCRGVAGRGRQGHDRQPHRRSCREQLLRDLPGPTVVPWEHRSAAVADHSLVVNTTALGMEGKETLTLDLSRAAPRTAVADIVYVPLETPLLQDAKAHDLIPVEGLGMLLYQGIPGFRSWFGVEPEVDNELRRFVAADLLPR